MANKPWSADDLPSQKGRISVVTGSTSGIGKETAKVLAKKQSTVVLAVRNVSKGEKVAAEIRIEYPDTNISVMQLDLSSLRSIQAFSSQFLATFDRLDLLINNAGVACPYARTDDGFEILMGTNHLGHFALVGHLLETLKNTPISRVVVVSAGAHKSSKIDLDDLNWEKRKYKNFTAYADSKLANLYFAYELKRRLESNGDNPMVTAAHPGWTTSELQRGVVKFLNTFFGQSKEMGALPTLRAATDERASSGDFFGPQDFFELHGAPIKVESSKQSHDVDAARKLWTLSEELTGIKY
ncbi:oxidoreductase [Vibrio ulleungensis]|uniref:SDR family NAD(P)-dependent oxidoreductase n=1 Tax=Vibrio ulleungensis TaxID=2807619 RepID=A0ABS2HLX2_9VIBR|nr:oxidoreductase [Vibrio ulleungensis]MBM7038490.1 SDR family NAD(P)-dependent oxidoreductase [Vibrio ulleungensis]